MHTAVMTFAVQQGMSAAEMEIDLSLEEALANARLHGCGDDAAQQIHCRVTADDHGLSIVIRDPGTGFDPERVPDPRSDEGLERHSGRGVHLIRSLMDEVRFAHHGAEITMRKLRR